MKKRCINKMLILGILFVCMGMVFIYWSVPYSPQKEEFDKDMQAYADTVHSSTEIVCKEEIENLPPALQRYCEYIGIEGMPKYKAIRVYFKDTDFIFDDKSGKVLKMNYDLRLFYDTWYRSAFCQSSMYGVPFEGSDYCTEEREGGMKGYLGKMVQIFDVHTEQGYQAGLISWFAESMALNPTVLFSDIVSFEQIDDLTVKVTLLDDDVKGEGLIYLNKEGEITAFYSDDRQVEDIEGAQMRIGWRCECEEYREQNGIKQPSKVKSVKVYPDKEVVYFSSDDFEVTYLK